MAIHAEQPESDTIERHPEGTFAARCIDVHDLGVEETQYGPKEKLLVTFQTTEEHPREPGDKIRPETQGPRDFPDDGRAPGVFRPVACDAPVHAVPAPEGIAP